MLQSDDIPAVARLLAVKGSVRYNNAAQALIRKARGALTVLLWFVGWVSRVRSRVWCLQELCYQDRSCDHRDSCRSIARCDHVSELRIGVVACGAAFRAVRGFPDVVGAIDGTLLAIERPESYDGFYCRKGYPAINVQAVVSANTRFMSVDVRPGAWSDRKIWRYCALGRRLHDIIPADSHLIGDAGYALQPGVMTPFIEREEGGQLSRLQRTYNYYHSSTRMVVECAFGEWKGRFHALQTTMAEKGLEQTVSVVVATMVLYNLFYNYGDTSSVPDVHVLDTVETTTVGLVSTNGNGDHNARAIAREKRYDCTDTRSVRAVREDGDQFVQRGCLVFDRLCLSSHCRRQRAHLRQDVVVPSVGFRHTRRRECGGNLRQPAL